MNPSALSSSCSSAVFTAGDDLETIKFTLLITLRGD